jgi:hypothetical protein
MNYQPINFAQSQYNQQNQQQTSSLIWVQGEAGAKSYLVAPNNTVQLWDSESPTIYLKSADASGMPSMKILDYTVRGEDKTPKTAPQPTQNTSYVTHDELNALENRVLEKIKEVAEV